MNFSEERGERRKVGRERESLDRGGWLCRLGDFGSILSYDLA